ncbi:MAG: hypothetical protein PHI02_06355 [Sulfurovaceae bacterium]|nr:hypothetical protein [Sulfurovaceae bacterium]
MDKTKIYKKIRKAYKLPSDYVLDERNVRIVSCLPKKYKGKKFLHTQFVFNEKMALDYFVFIYPVIQKIKISLDFKAWDELVDNKTELECQ